MDVQKCLPIFIVGSSIMLLMGCATKQLPPHIVAAANYGPAPRPLIIKQ